jgi:hypothetical protein
MKKTKNTRTEITTVFVYIHAKSFDYYSNRTTRFVFSSLSILRTKRSTLSMEILLKTIRIFYSKIKYETLYMERQ